MKTVTLLNATADAIAKEMNRAAVKNKSFALDLMQMPNLKGNMTGKYLRQLCKDYFDKSGKLTDSGREKMFPDTPKNYNLRQIFEDVLKECYSVK